MDTLLLHPKLIHIPLALAVLMPVMSAALLLAWRRGWLPGRTWLMAVGLQAVLAGGAMLSSWSGEADEDRVETVVGHAAIEAHEHAAEAFTFATGVVLVLMIFAAALGLRRTDPRPGMWAAAVAVAGTLVVAGLGVRTGEKGGELVYRHGAARAWQQVPSPLNEHALTDD